MIARLSRQGSIRRRLLAGVAAVQIVAAILVTVLVVRHEERQSYALLDAQIVERAATVQAVIEPPDTPADKVILHRELLSLPRLDVYVLSDATRIIAASGDWRMPGPLPSAPRSFVRTRIHGRRYRVLVLQNVALMNDAPEEVARLAKMTLIYGAPTFFVEEHVEHVAWIAASVGLALLLASLAATGWVVRAGLQPLVEIAGQAARIDATHWDWHAEASAGQAAELVPLSTALTHLVERLRAAFLRERQFSADAAHEMKTAVAIVKSTLQLALERDRSAEAYRVALDRALEDTDRIQALVNGMLQLARFEGLGAAEQSDGPDAIADVEAAILEVQRRLAPILAAREIALHLDLPQTKLAAAIPLGDLSLVLMNLLENAIHYSPRASQIHLRASGDASWVVLAVEDTGVGMDAEALTHIFERFYRGDPSRSRASGGNGLGLAIVQAILQRAGGSIAVTSEPGVGSTFTIRLRRAPNQSEP